MSREVIEMIREMDSQRIENQLILQCAPLIVGLRISNLFIVPNRDVRRICMLLRDSSISYYIIHRTAEKTTMFLFYPDRLETYFQDSDVRRFLSGMGYHNFGLREVMFGFCKRYADYRCGTEDFPHELGLLLGYPLEDVEGYIRNEGDNALYTGYWKVYAHVAEKCRLFRMFELAKETLIALVNNGVSVPEIIEVYGANQRISNIHRIAGTV